MARLKWDQIGKRLFETGTSKGVLFTQEKDGTYSEGVAWSGLQAVKQAPDGAEPTKIYADNIVYGTLESAENFKGTIEAFMYPDEFSECDGSKKAAPGVYVGQQGRKPFGMVYSTIIGSDTAALDYGEKIHIIYGARVAPSARDYQTVNESPEAMPLSWAFDTTPVDPEVEGFKPTAYISVSSAEVPEDKFKKLKDLIYGTDGVGDDGENGGTPAKLPTLKEIIELVGTV